MGLDVQDRRPVQHVQASDLQDVALRVQDIQDGHADGVGSNGRTDTEYAHSCIPMRWGLNEKLRRETGTLVEMEYDDNFVALPDVSQSFKISVVHDKGSFHIRDCPMPGHIFNVGFDDPDRSESHLHWLLAFRWAKMDWRYKRTEWPFCHPISPYVASVSDGFFWPLLGGG